MTEKLIHAYQKGGIGRLLKTGLYNLVVPIEEKTIKKSRLKYPYFVKKHQLISQYTKNRWLKKGFGQELTYESICEHKSSNTLFILGSGQSINEISERYWDHISRHDSVGLNRWPVHDFTPTYYVYELSKNIKNFNKTYIKLINYRKDEYSDVPMIIKDISHYYYPFIDSLDIPPWIRDNSLLTVESEFGTLFHRDAATEENEALLNYLVNNGYFDQGRFKCVYKKRGSISYLLSFAVVMGYKNVVLCGVDMNNSIHFFDTDKYRKSDIPIPGEVPDDPDSPHKTNDPSYGSLTLDKVIYTMDDIVLEPKGIDLMVQNKTSELYPTLDTHDPKIS